MVAFSPSSIGPLTYVSLPSASSASQTTGYVVSDVSADGNVVLMSNGSSYQTPGNNAIKILTLGIPFIIPSNGTMSNNGAFTLGTALLKAYPVAYVHFASGMISSGSTAGWYYCVFSSTTAGTVYNNTYSSGKPAIPASPTAFSTTGPGAFTGQSNINTGIQCTIKGNLLGKQGVVRLTGRYGFCGVSGDNIQLSVFLGSAACYQFNMNGSAGTTYWILQELTINNLGATNLQGSHTLQGFGGVNSGVTYTSIDTTSDQTLLFYLTPLVTANAQNTVVEMLTVEVLPG